MKYTKEKLQEVIKVSSTWAEVCRYFGLKPSTGSQSHLKRRVQKFELDFSHFNTQPHNKGLISKQRKDWSELLILREAGQRQKSHLLTRALKDYGRDYCCAVCANKGLWNDKPLTLEVDHINNNWLDDRPENLRFLCSNCHTQETKMFRTGSLDKKTYSCYVCNINSVSRNKLRCRPCYEESRRINGRVDKRQSHYA